MAQSLHLHRNVKACLVLQEEGAKEGDDYIVLPAIRNHQRKFHDRNDYIINGNDYKALKDKVKDTVTKG